MGALLLDSDVACQAVHIHGQHHAPVGSIALGDKGGNHAREAVAAASGGHAGVAAAVDVDLAIGAHRHGVVALEHDGDLVELRDVDGFLEALLVGAMQVEEAVKLGLVRREYRPLGNAAQQDGALGNAIEGVGIENAGLAVALQEGVDGVDSLVARAHARPQSHHAVLVVKVDVGGEDLVAVGLEEHLGHGCRQGHKAAARGVHSDQARTGAGGTAGGEHSGSHHAVAAGHEKDRAVVILVDKRVVRAQGSLHVVALDEIEVGGHLGDGALVHVEVEHLHLAHKLGVLGKEEREALELEGQRELGLDDVAVVGAHVPLSKQARGHVDRDGIGARVVDVLHQSRVAALERAAQPRAEEAVEHNVVGTQLGRVEGVDHLVEFHVGAVLQAVLVGRAARRQVRRLDVEQVHLRPVALLREHARRSQRIAAVVAGPGKYHQAL